MDVANVDEIAIRTIFGTAIALDHKNMMMGVEGNGDSVMKRGWSSIGAPVEGVDGEAGASDYRFGILSILHRIIADGDASVTLALGRTYMTGRKRIFRCYLIA